MASSIKKLALSLGLTLALGAAFAPLGCGGSRRGSGAAGSGDRDAEVPEHVALQIRTCAAKRREHLGSAELSVSFDVELSSEGDVDSIALRDSTLGDEMLEACMAHALRSLSENDLLRRRSDNRPRRPLAPDSRALLGQEQVLGCLASPPCLLALAFLVGATYIVVQIYIHASLSKPRTAPIATTAPLDVDCKKVKDDCIDRCSDTSLPTPDFGAKFQKCLRACMEASGC